MARFKRDLDDLFGDAMRSEDGKKIRHDWWSALSNIIWHHEDGTGFSCSFRSAGDIIAYISEDGSNYMDYYCQSSYETVSKEIEEGMKSKGWSYTIYRGEEK